MLLNPGFFVSLTILVPSPVPTPQLALVIADCGAPWLLLLGRGGGAAVGHMSPCGSTRAAVAIPGPGATQLMATGRPSGLMGACMGCGDGAGYRCGKSTSSPTTGILRRVSWPGHTYRQSPSVESDRSIAWAAVMARRMPQGRGIRVVFSHACFYFRRSATYGQTDA